MQFSFHDGDFRQLRPTGIPFEALTVGNPGDKPLLDLFLSVRVPPFGEPLRQPVRDGAARFQLTACIMVRKHSGERSAVVQPPFLAELQFTSRSLRRAGGLARGPDEVRKRNPSRHNQHDSQSRTATGAAPARVLAVRIHRPQSTWTRKNIALGAAAGSTTSSSRISDAGLK